MELDPVINANVEAGMQTHAADLRKIFHIAKDFLHRAKAPALAGLAVLAGLTASCAPETKGQVFEQCVVTIPANQDVNIRPIPSTIDDLGHGTDFITINNPYTITIGAPSAPELAVGTNGEHRIIWARHQNGWVAVAPGLNGVRIDCDDQRPEVDSSTGQIELEPIPPTPAPTE